MFSFVLCSHTNALSGTGKFQPADVGMQRIFKHIIKIEALNFIVFEMKKQVDQGIPPCNVEIPNGIKELRDASVAWVQKAYMFFRENPQIIKEV